MDIRDATQAALNFIDRAATFRQADLNGKVGLGLDRAQELIASDDLETSDFKMLMRLGFGSGINNAFTEDGAVDYEALQQAVTTEITDQRTAAVDRRLWAAELGVQSGLLPPSTLQEGLSLRYGDAVTEAFGDESAVDFERLKSIILGQVLPGSTGETENTLDATA
jgi:hypothetical protein